jgi:hypothetical protein
LPNEHRCWAVICRPFGPVGHRKKSFTIILQFCGFGLTISLTLTNNRLGELNSSRPSKTWF